MRALGTHLASTMFQCPATRDTGEGVEGCQWGLCDCGFCSCMGFAQCQLGLPELLLLSQQSHMILHLPHLTMEFPVPITIGKQGLPIVNSLL